MKSVLDFKKLKIENKKISMVTCYDHWSAKVLAKTPVDCLLVGDSVSMVVHGFDSTIHATLEMMKTHTQAVSRAQTGKLIISDMPFLSHRQGIQKMVQAADTLMKAGAQALKIETAPGQEEAVRHLVESGIPVIGHLGLTPQHVHQFGGYKVQGKTQEASHKIFEHALKLEEAGCQALVLECVPLKLAKKITDSTSCATIGIGAGLGVNGQVLVLHDLLGFDMGFKPRFVRQFAHGEKWMEQALKDYSQAVKEENFPSQEESFQ